MRPHERRRFHCLVKHLKASVPLSLPVSVRVMAIPKRLKLDGYTTWDGERLLIRIHNGRLKDAIETLVHEWGHALVICDGYSHSEFWGRKHSEAYQAWEEWDSK